MRDAFTPYLALGWSCFPVQHAGKRPLFSWEQYQAAPPTPEEIARWCEDYTRANVAIATGAVSGLVVIDVDSAAGLDALSHYGRLPETPRVKTGHGWHYYFQHPGFKLGNKARFVEGVDVRGDGGYVIAPPSVHETGAIYEWEVSPEAAPLATIPEWLMGLLRPPVRPPQAETRPAPEERSDGSKWLNDALAQASQGTRDEWAFWLACQLRDNGLSHSEAESVLRTYAAQVMQGTDPYTEREALAKVRSAWTQPPRGPAKSDRARLSTAPRTTLYPDEQWHEGPPREFAEEGQEPAPPPKQFDDGGKLWVDTNEVFARVLAEVLEEPDTLSTFPPFLFPFKLLHQFSGFAHYAWRGKMCYVLGGPGFGKTSFGETLAEAMLKAGDDWVWYGPEWSPLEMGYRYVQRNGGMDMNNVAAYQVNRHAEARGVSQEQRPGLVMGAAVKSASVDALDVMTQWPGTGYFIDKAALTIDDLVTRVTRAVTFSRERGRNPVAWYVDYLQIMRRFSAASDAMWGERLLTIIKDVCIDLQLLGIVFLQPRKEDTDRVRDAGLNAVDMNTDNTWLLDQNSAQGISDQQCNLYITLNPQFDTNGRMTGHAKLNVVKNSLGQIGSTWCKTDLARLRYLDSATSTAK
jgi:hypothetical protein